jgi:anti-sigma factor RsiW
MDCQNFQKSADAWIDGELAAEDADAVQSHAEACPACRELADQVKTQHQLLLKLFAGRRATAKEMTEKVMSRLTESPGTARPVRLWIHWMAASAAGFLLAAAIFGFNRPDASPVAQGPNGQDRPTPPEGADTSSPTTSPPASAGTTRLALATGPVEVQSKESGGWMNVLAPIDLPDDARVRTKSDGQCAIACSDGSQIRLNRDTEIEFTSYKEIQVVSGEVYGNVAAADPPYVFTSANARVSASDSMLLMTCPSDVTEVAVLSGEPALRGLDSNRPLTPGQSVAVSEGKVIREELQPVDRLIYATSWMHPLLMQEAAARGELEGRVDLLLARFGEDKLTYLYEDEIRLLGSPAALPIARYIATPRSAERPERRRAAARILADVADAEMIPELIDLLGDEDGMVRREAARALERLTGRSEGLSADEWASAPRSAGAEAQKQWRNWWIERGRRTAPVEEPFRVKKS